MREAAEEDEMRDGNMWLRTMICGEAAAEDEMRDGKLRRMKWAIS